MEFGSEQCDNTAKNIQEHVIEQSNGEGQMMTTWVCGLTFKTVLPKDIPSLLKLRSGDWKCHSHNFILCPRDGGHSYPVRDLTLQDSKVSSQVKGER